MRILICTPQVPFVSGGAELQVRDLKAAFIERGHAAEIVSIPFQWHPPARIVRSMLVWRMLDLNAANGQPVDMVVAMKFPAYLIQHPNKVIWLTHQHRQAYDLMGTEYGDLRHDDETQKVREIIADGDTRFIPQARRVYAISATVAQRLRKFNGVAAEPLYHPPPGAAAMRSNGYGDYVFYPSRLDRLKRQELLIEAMALVKTRATCVLAGTGPDDDRLRSLIARRGVERRVKMLGFVNELELGGLVFQGARDLFRAIRRRLWIRDVGSVPFQEGRFDAERQWGSAGVRAGRGQRIRGARGARGDREKN